MGGYKDERGSGTRTVTVDDAAVPASGWQALDLRRTTGRLPRQGTQGPDPAAIAWSAGTVLTTTPAWTGTAISGQPNLYEAVPASAFVRVGRKVRAEKRGRAAMAHAGQVANDNLTAPQPRSVWRDLFFLAILAATVIGAFWSGRVHGLQKVIVVPGPSSFYSVVT